jgi:hypothetical protein
LVTTDEQVQRAFLLYQTSAQQTWLVLTNRKVFCILDDERTRASGRLIQWRLPLEDAQPVRAHLSDRGSPVIDIGLRKDWLYSTKLHSSPHALEKDLTAAVLATDLVRRRIIQLFESRKT